MNMNCKRCLGESYIYKYKRVCRRQKVQFFWVMLTMNSDTSAQTDVSEDFPLE